MDPGSSNDSSKYAENKEANVRVFVLTPAELANMGLLTRVENGRTVLLPIKHESESRCLSSSNEPIEKKSNKTLNIVSDIVNQCTSLQRACSVGFDKQIKNLHTDSTKLIPVQDDITDEISVSSSLKNDAAVSFSLLPHTCTLPNLIFILACSLKFVSLWKSIYLFLSKIYK